MIMDRVTDNPGVKFALRCKTGEKFVSQTTPLRESMDPKLAVRFGGTFLNSTVWGWQYNYDAVPWPPVAKSTEETAPIVEAPDPAKAPAPTKAVATKPESAKAKKKASAKSK
jgi:hypothetical protein